jgi:hypothetical protein
MDRIVFDPADPRTFTLEGEGFALTLGPDEDELVLGALRGTAPHANNDRSLTLGVVENQLLEVGPVGFVLTDGIETRELTVEFAVLLPAIALP